MPRLDMAPWPPPFHPPIYELAMIMSYDVRCAAVIAVAGAGGHCRYITERGANSSLGYDNENEMGITFSFLARIFGMRFESSRASACRRNSVPPRRTIPPHCRCRCRCHCHHRVVSCRGESSYPRSVNYSRQDPPLASPSPP